MPSTKSRKTLEHNWRFEALGTAWEISSRHELTDEVRERIAVEVEAFDATYSRFRPDSLVTKLAKNPGAYTFPDNASTLFNFYDELYEISRGSVSPLVGGALEEAGYDAAYSLRPKGEPRVAIDYSKAISRDEQHLTVEEPLVIDIGAIGKGYLVDCLANTLRAAGHDDFTVDGSGDMRTVGGTKETVGLENPLNTNEVIGTVELQNASLCASAINRRAWGEWHHVIDATTGLPTREIIATWVVADSTMIADGLATALFFVSPGELAKRYTYEYMRMHADGSIEYSDYFAKGVF